MINKMTSQEFANYLYNRPFEKVERNGHLFYYDPTQRTFFHHNPKNKKQTGWYEARGLKSYLAQCTKDTNVIKSLDDDGKVVVTSVNELLNTEERTEYKERENISVKPQQKRTRRFCLTSYINRTDLERYVSSLPWVQHWAMCTHDRDINEDSTPKECHTHILLYTYEAKTSSAIKKNFDRFSQEVYQGTDMEPQNTLVMICHDMSAQWRYLIHKDNGDKAQYNENERICDNYAYWLDLERLAGLNDASNNTALAIVNDILDGVSTMEMLKRYGREYAINRMRYKEVAREHIRENDRAYCHDGLDLVTLCLESKYSKEQIYLWLEMLYYVRAECLMEYGQRVDVISDGNYIQTTDLKTITEM